MLEEETNYKWNGKIALASASDYLDAHSNQSMCGTDKTNYENYETCRNLDWMYIPGEWFWLVSPYAGSDYADSEFIVYAGGYLGSNSAGISSGVRPAFYLSSDISLSGSGTSSDPYRIN